jgi:hypothetical protein
MRPHKIHVEPGWEYHGEMYLWCDCRVPDGTGSLRGCYVLNGQSQEALFTGDNPEDLLAWLKEHGETAL